MANDFPKIKIPSNFNIKSKKKEKENIYNIDSDAQAFNKKLESGNFNEEQVERELAKLEAKQKKLLEKREEQERQDEQRLNVYEGKNRSTKSLKRKTQKTSKPDKNYHLIDAIRKHKDYKSNVGRRDKNARKIMNEFKVTGPNDAIPGQLISFNYMQPKYMEELEYYDARPVTIFFGRIKTKNGLRIMGFNIHYYPPRIRFKIMDRIMEIWKPMYFKCWETGLINDLSHFDYQWLQEQLDKAGLGFGVRMYIPNLTGSIRVIPPKNWVDAVFSEGVFRKKTRFLILQYWKKFQLKQSGHGQRSVLT